MYIKKLVVLALLSVVAVDLTSATPHTDALSMVHKMIEK